jgi:ankyrin repeat protein
LGCTPLWIAAGYNRIECLEYLITRVSQRIEHNKGDVFEQYLLDANDSGDSPFLAAASRGNVDVCKYLLGSIDTFLEGNHEWRDDAKRKLLRTANKAGDTPLKVAVAAGHDIELLTFLLETDLSLNDSEESLSGEGLCINRKNNLGLSPLIVASERNQSSVVELLMKFGADTHVRDKNGRNILAIASFCGCDDVVRFLISCIKQSSSESVALLLNDRDDLGCTPLRLAVRTGKLSMVELLINAGADETIADEDGLTPKAVASRFKKEKVEEYFNRRLRS